VADELAHRVKSEHYLQLKVQLLEEHLRLQRIKKYVLGSEKLSNLQLELLEQSLGSARLRYRQRGHREKPASCSQTNPKQAHPGRQSLPASLSRVERMIACTSEQCTCTHCKQETAVIGYDQSEQLEVEPPKYFVMVIKREKRGCRHCSVGNVVAAPLPARIIETNPRVLRTYPAIGQEPIRKSCYCSIRDILQQCEGALRVCNSCGMH
jgi:transposase